MSWLFKRLLRAADVDGRGEVKRPNEPTPGIDTVSRRAVWRWCSMWKCWESSDYTYKIHPVRDGYNCSSHEVWHDGLFETFSDAEAEVLGLEEGK